jgi:hypothetical protein
MLDDKDIKNLFTMMTTLFGHKFKSAYGTGVNGNKLSITGKVWQRTLNNIEQNIKRKTLKITRDEHNVRLSKYYVANYKGGNDKDYQYHLNNIKINGDNK